MKDSEYLKIIHDDVKYIRSKQDTQSGDLTVVRERLAKVEVKSGLLGFIGGFAATLLKGF